jgi:hypothetical protein
LLLLGRCALLWQLSTLLRKRDVAGEHASGMPMIVGLFLHYIRSLLTRMHAPSCCTFHEKRKHARLPSLSNPRHVGEEVEGMGRGGEGVGGKGQRIQG